MFQIDREDSIEIWPENCDPAYQIPSEIDVTIFNDGGYKNTSVEVVIESCSKPYIGGYRNTSTGQHFHHAITQTQESWCFQKFQKKISIDTTKLNTREIQTQELKNNNTQSYREYGTQMQRSDIYIDHHTDTIITPRKYVTAGNLNQLKKRSAVIIQKHWRSSLARTLAKTLSIEKKEMLRRESELRSERERKEMEFLAAERLRREQPKTLDDFELVLSELYENHTKRIKDVGRELITTVGSEVDLKSHRRKAAVLSELLDGAARSIADLDKRRMHARRTLFQDWVQRDLEKMATPLRWSLTGQLTGDMCTVVTPQSVRATELRDIYVNLEAPVVSASNRLEVLSRARSVLNGNDRLVLDIHELLDRERDLLERGRSAHMTQLRLRLLHLVTTYIHSPEHNPAAGLRDRRVPKQGIP